MRSWLGKLLRGRGEATLPPEARGAAVVQFLRATPVARSWARMHSGSLEEVWNACPRADWLVDIALRSGIERERILEIVRRAFDGFDPGHDDELVDALGAFLDQRVDSDHEVLAARALEAYNVRANHSIQRLWDELPDARVVVDDLENGFHRAMAQRVRDELPYQVLRARLYPGAAVGPYR